MSSPLHPRFIHYLSNNLTKQEPQWKYFWTQNLASNPHVIATQLPLTMDNGELLGLPVTKCLANVFWNKSDYWQVALMCWGLCDENGGKLFRWIIQKLFTDCQFYLIDPDKFFRYYGVLHQKLNFERNQNITRKHLWQWTIQLPIFFPIYSYTHIYMMSVCQNDQISISVHD